MKETLKKAFSVTIPIMVGYIFLGMAFGILLSNAGYSWFWALAMGIIIYSGALQFVCITFLPGTTPLASMILISVLMNVRHCFYGLSMLEKYKGTGKVKPYLIETLTDETFSVLSGLKIEEGIDKGQFYFWVSFLNQCYWLIGSVLGALLKEQLPFNTEGIDFAMTALFVVLFVEQLIDKNKRFSSFLGIIVSAAALLVVGKQFFIVCSLAVISLILLMTKKEEQV